jgi:NADPH-dependent curcumin reductase CurA
MEETLARSAAGLKNIAMRIARAPGRTIAPEDFAPAEAPAPEPKAGELLVRTIYLAMSPGSRAMMPEPASAATDLGDLGGSLRPRRLQVGEVMCAGSASVFARYSSGAVGVVEVSRHPGFAPGDYVVGAKDWQLYEIVPGDRAWKADPAQMPIELELGLFGSSAFTGYCGYVEVSAPKPGETLLVSAAAGPTGMIVGQLARRDGLKVVGVAGGAEKCRYLTEELGFDAAIDRRREDVAEAVDRLCPEGIDIYFDNVGGQIRDLAFARLRPFGRLIVCGMAGDYGGGESAARLNMTAVLGKRLTIRGFVVYDHAAAYEDFRRTMTEGWRSGAVKFRQQVFKGLERAPEALAACLSGQSAGGQILVQVSADTSKGEA